MAFDFKKAFNSQVKVANKLNQGLNKIIGKDVFGEVKELEDPREFAPYESFPEYTELEPVDWPLLEGERQEFNFAGNTISFPKELDTCMRYRKYFKEAAEFYAARFAFKYQHCVEDFDTLVHYFTDFRFRRQVGDQQHQDNTAQNAENRLFHLLAHEFHSSLMNGSQLALSLVNYLSSWF